MKFTIMAACATLVLSAMTGPGRAELIHLMARKGDAARVLDEIGKGVAVDLPSTMHANLKGSSPLYVASTYGRLEVVEALLGAGADPNYRRPEYLGENTYGSPIHAAVSGEHTEVVRLLLDAGADPDVADPTIGTPLHIARQRGNAAIEAMLLDAGAATRGEAAPSILSMLAEADVERGGIMAGGCAQCHDMTRGATEEGMEGPPLWDVLGRGVGSVDGYAYTPWLVAFGGAWDLDRINAFLADPYGVIPGTSMAFTGVEPEADRADIIAYLRTLSDSPVPLP